MPREYSVEEIAAALRELKENKNQYLIRHTRTNYRIESIRKLGGKCVRCGFQDYRALNFDHIEGGGNEIKASVTSHSNKDYETFKAIQDGNHEGLQLLCANCNQIKKYENQEGCREDLNTRYVDAMSEDLKAEISFC